MTGARQRLLHLTPLAAVGGCEINCLRAIEGMPDAHHRVVVFDGEGPMSSCWKEKGVEVTHLGTWQHGRKKFHASLRSWMKGSETPDGVLYWSTSRLPLVLDALHEWRAPWAVHAGNPLTHDLRSSVRRWWQHLGSTSLPPVTLIACSEQVALSHRRAPYFRRFPVEVVYNAVGTQFRQERVYRALPAGSGVRVGMVARLDAIKDHLTLLRAMAIVKPRRPDAVLELAGDGPLRATLEAEAKRLELGDRVRFLGFTDVPSVLAGWDVYLHSTTGREGMGTAVAEAMTAGLPCLLGDLPVMREVGGNFEVAYAPPADATAWGLALIELIGDLSRRSSMGQAAQRRAERLFSLAPFADAYRQALALAPRRKVA